MTNGRGGSSASMASFMTKKKKYKFQVDICLEELLEVPFVSAVLFAKLRLLDGGNFQDHSSRQEVMDHKVQWDANFAFPCKMMANASTGVMEKCILRISMRKECKGGRSFTKLGFVDLNLAEYAGAGLIHKKALLEGYDARHRQDNSMLKYRIQLTMISGDIMFKAPSPTLKHKQVNVEPGTTDQRSDEFSSESLAGSIASASSGFGSLPKKRPPLLTSDLVASQPLSELNPGKAKAPDSPEFSILAPSIGERLEQVQSDAQASSQPNPIEQGHSRNSSNTSQLSKASGYSTQHSRQSSSGDSVGHMRHPHHSSLRTNSSSGPLLRTYTVPKQKINIPTTILSESINSSDGFYTPLGGNTPSLQSNSTPATPTRGTAYQNEFDTPRNYCRQKSNISSGSEDVFKTPEGSFIGKTEVFSKNFNALQKSASSSVVEKIKTGMVGHPHDVQLRETVKNDINDNLNQGVLRSKSEFLIPIIPASEKSGSSKFFKSDSLFSFLTPRPSRKISTQSTPTDQWNHAKHAFKLTPPSLRSSLRAPPTFRGPPSPLKLVPDAKATSLNSLRFLGGVEGSVSGQPQGVIRNPSSGSLAASETGSLDRAKSSYERRKKNPTGAGEESSGVSGKVEITRVNPEEILDELFKGAKLEPDDSAETSGLQLFIDKDGRAALGNHEVKSQMSTGVQTFKQVVMDNR